MNPVRVERFTGTRYKGNYLDSHDDNTEDRVLTVVYHNTKDWDPKCRGEFVWQGGNGGRRELPSYNTLYLFIPRTRLFRTLYRQSARGERFAISGWLYADEVDSILDNASQLSLAASKIDPETYGTSAAPTGPSQGRAPEMKFEGGTVKGTKKKRLKKNFWMNYKEFKVY